MTEPEQPKTEPTPETNTVAASSSKIDDPLVLEYANSLKESLGELYDADMDKMEIKERISTMKLVKKSMDKLLKDRKSEGKAPIDPKPETKHKVLNAIQRAEQGIDPLEHIRTSRTSAFSSARKNIK